MELPERISRQYRREWQTERMSIMPLNMEDGERIRQMIVAPVVEAIKFEFQSSFTRHDERLKHVEEGQKKENDQLDAIESRLTAGDKRMDGFEQFKKKIAVVYGLIAAAVTLVFNLAKDKFMAWLRGHK